jgi:hypothetical protein
VSGWITYALLTVGLVYLITQSTILMPLRVALTRGSHFRAALFYCPSCTGFWVGTGLAFAGLVPERNYTLGIVFGGVLSVAIAHIWSALTQQGVNPAWEAEQPLREVQHNAPQEETTTDG